jgi:hypothetical protein
VALPPVKVLAGTADSWRSALPQEPALAPSVGELIIIIIIIIIGLDLLDAECES